MEKMPKNDIISNESLIFVLSFALRKILQEAEGIFVNLPLPGEGYRKLVVYRKKDIVCISPAEDFKDFGNGLMVWVHDTEEELEKAKELREDEICIYNAVG